MRDGEVVRSLRVWIRNKTEDPTPWEPILDKIRKKLKLWKRSHPMIYGKCLITQAIVGGHTQFLVMVQGMLRHIEEALIKIMRDFIWEHNTSPRIALEHLYKPIDEEP